MTFTKRLSHVFKASVPNAVALTKAWYEAHGSGYKSPPIEPLVPIVEIEPCRREGCTLPGLHAADSCYVETRGRKAKNAPKKKRRRRPRRRPSTIEVIGDPVKKLTPAEGRRKRMKQGFQTKYTIKRMQPGPNGPVAIVGCTWCSGKGCDKCYGQGEMTLMMWYQRQR